MVTSGGAPVSTVVADPGGEFSLPLNPGAYRVIAAAPAFRSAELDIKVGSDGTVDSVITLQVAPQAQSVTVVEDAYQVNQISAATKGNTPLINVPQSVSVVTRELVRDQMMMSMGDVVRYVPGITAIQGENNRDQVVIRGNSSSADFFVNGVRDDVQYFRDLYNLERVEALKGPNAMIFGRGGGGGVINRVTKAAGAAPLREITIQGGSFGNKRVTADFDQPIGREVAARLNGVYENSDSFREFVGLERYALNPTVSLSPSDRTRITLGYEYLHDRRVADRGISSFRGRPADVDVSSYYGNPDDSHVQSAVNLGSAAIEHQVGRMSIRNRTLVGDYDRFYQNYVPGAVNSSQTLVPLTSYGTATTRRNLFNQTDLTYTLHTGRIRHNLLWGAEFGNQHTDNFRFTGYFGNTLTSVSVPYTDGVIRTPVTFRQSPTDANNGIQTRVAATYFQDQVELSRFVQLVVGVRFDRFDLQFHNKRTEENLRRTDDLVSPRAGLILKPMSAISLYTNYSVSWLPSSGDQFSSLTTITQQVKPEKFENYEAGVKWDLARQLSVTTAVYRLDRTNTRAVDPNDPTRILQTGSQRTKGYELGLNGNVVRKWRVAGGYAYQDAYVTSATAAARAGAQVAQVPHHTFSFWNHYQVMPRLSAGLGILNRTDMFAGIDNTVILPGYLRADAALFYSLTEKIRLQANVENLTNQRYYLNADSNTNISPGSPRAVRIGMIARF
jgi:catecholate siderophore receptor